MSDARNSRRVAAGLILAAFPLLLSASAAPVPNVPSAVDAVSGPVESLFPNAPEKALVLAHCTNCHGLEWIARTGGTVEGWTSRLRRMIRSGSTIPPDDIPAVAAYLAKAFPVRERPPAG